MSIVMLSKQIDSVKLFDRSCLLQSMNDKLSGSCPLCKASITKR